MDRDHHLAVGDVLRCPHCARWHPLMRPYTDGTEYTMQMLMLTSAGMARTMPARLAAQADSRLGVRI